MRIPIILCLLTLLGTACATVSSNTNANVSYSETARQNFELGEKALADGRNEEAMAYFEYVRNKYPYSKYAADSDLKMADTFFKEEKWLEAADAYDFFIRFHPVHEKIAYAYFRAAKSNSNAMPTDFFLFPKSFTKDQTATKEALSSIDRFLTQFPADENVKEAKEMRVQLRDQIALQHMHVAKFYAARKKWRGAAQRFDEVVKSFSDTPSARRATLSLAGIKKEHLDKADEAKELLELLVKEHPESEEAKEAQAKLGAS